MSQICRTYSSKLSKNSTSNASVLQQLKKPDKLVKIQGSLLQTLEMTKHITIQYSIVQ